MKDIKENETIQNAIKYHSCLFRNVKKKLKKKKVKNCTMSLSATNKANYGISQREQSTAFGNIYYQTRGKCG